MPTSTLLKLCRYPKISWSVFYIINQINILQVHNLLYMQHIYYNLCSLLYSSIDCIMLLCEFLIIFISCFCLLLRHRWCDLAGLIREFSGGSEGVVCGTGGWVGSMGEWGSWIVGGLWFWTCGPFFVISYYFKIII